jgi:C-terminal processing protease CtpA/Prc
MKKILLIIAVCLAIFTSCEDPAPNPTPAIMARDTLYDKMNQWYYWYDKMPAVNKENYSDPYTLLEALRYKELDESSYVIDYDTYMAQMQGTYVTHGIRLALDESQKARIAMIYRNTHLYEAGVRRGWIIKTINGHDIADLLIRNDSKKLAEVLGPQEAGVTNVFLFSPPGQADVSISSTKNPFTANSVLLFDTIHLSKGSIAGHLVLTYLGGTISNELKTAFEFFKANNVSDFILDLRYSTGGLSSPGKELASYIAGSSATGSVFAKFLFNDKNQNSNKTLTFADISNQLAVSKLVVITSRSTVGEAEVVMNGLYPIINTVVSVGDTTEGDPAISLGWPCLKKYYFWLVTAKTVNSLDQDFYDGFPPDKREIDDITREFDDRQEECLKEAILYLETGQFSGKGETPFYRSVQFSEEPSLINNAFTRK